MMSPILFLCRIEWDSDDDTWTPDMKFESVSYDEDSEDEDVDPDYRPTIRVKYVLQMNVHFNRYLDIPNL